MNLEILSTSTLSTPDYIQLSISIFMFLAVIVALFGERIRRLLYRPRITINFDKKNERCFRWAIIPTDLLQDQGLFRDVKRYYFRLKITNQGATVARQLKAKAELYFANGKLADRFEPSTLHWISGLEVIDLASKEDWYLDLFSQVVERVDVKYKLRVELANRTPRGIAWDRRLETYIAKVSLYGANLSKPVVRFFKFSSIEGKGKPGRLEEIPHI